jgi:hypothetical protein
VAIWRLPPGMLEELTGKVEGLLQSSGPAHQYVDLAASEPTLLLSVDEYVPSASVAKRREIQTVRH